VTEQLRRNFKETARKPETNVRSEKVPVEMRETKASPAADLFLPILQEAKKQTQLPIVLPSELPTSYNGLSAVLVRDKNSAGEFRYRLRV